MSNKAPAWVEPVMRAGYGARGLVYTIVGGLALTAAIYGGQAQGTTNALADLRSQSWGVAALWVIAVGLWAYMLWRFIDAAMDLENYGDGAKGSFARGGLIVTGAIHAALGISVATTAMGGGSSGEGTQSLVARLMAVPYGQWLVGLVGLGAIGAGVYYAHKGWTEKYKEDIRVTPTTRKLDPAMKIGCIAQGIVVGIIGVMIVYAALTTNPEQAGGTGEALQQIREAPFGRFLLAGIALGLIGFAIENFVEAAYRIIPAHAGDDVMSLARRAKLKAEGKLNEATS